MKQQATITINTMDDEGNVVDTTAMELPLTAVSDIVDHAAQLILVLRDMARGRQSINDFDAVISELEDALVAPGVIDSCNEPKACMGLLSTGAA